MDNCDVVRDLLPLYVDGVCSEESRVLVETHTASCPACAGILAQLRDSACEESLRREAGAVLAPRRWRNRAFAVSCALAAFLCVPACILAALEPEILAGSGGNWLFCLFLLPPSLLVVMSAIALPLRCRRYTGRWTLLGCTASLFLLLMACALYSGRMLFRAGVVGLYALSTAVIVPWAVRELPLPGVLGKKKALAVLTWAGMGAFLLLTAWCLLARPPHYVRSAVGAGGLLLALGAVEVVLAKKLPVGRSVRAGICVALASCTLVWLIRPFVVLTGAEKNVRDGVVTVCAVIWAVGVAFGVALVARGAWQSWRRDTGKP